MLFLKSRLAFKHLQSENQLVPRSAIKGVQETGSWGCERQDSNGWKRPAAK